MRKLEGQFNSGDVVIGIAADSGERYLDGVYSNEWVASNFPELALKRDARRISRSASAASSVQDDRVAPQELYERRNLRGLVQYQAHAAATLHEQ